MHLLLILAVAPGAFLVYLVYKHDKIEKEPAILIRKLLIAGAISVIPAIIIELIGSAVLELFWDGSPSLFFTAVDAFIITALTEEMVKYIPLKKITWKNPEFNYTFDAIVYAVCSGMGFAILENIAYVFENGLGNALLRAVTSIPGHAVFAVYMGYYYGLAKQCETIGDTKGVKLFLKKALWIPVLIHGFYDFCLMSDSGLLVLVFFVFIGILYFRTYKNLKKFSAGDTAIEDDIIDNVP
ncbi:MAG: PrsW family intramembrane metalloprotease [Lachnospiraceae bacterium]|nr:PrsW family intramembrane metalloprotease [Lachnospiraceae bacterium]